MILRIVSAQITTNVKSFAQNRDFTNDFRRLFPLLGMIPGVPSRLLSIKLKILSEMFHNNISLKFPDIHYD